MSGDEGKETKESQPKEAHSTEKDDKIAQKLHSSIARHKSWIKRYEKELEDLEGDKCCKSDLGDRLYRLKSIIEEKTEKLIEIYERNDMETKKLDSELIGMCEYITGLIRRYVKWVKNLEKEKTESTDNSPQDTMANTTRNTGRSGAQSTNSSGNGTATATQGSAGSARAANELDSSGLFVVPDARSGISNAEQRNIERIQVEGMKKLPNITLRIFSGKGDQDFSRWKFHFMSVIGSQETLSKRGKLTFLLQALGGRALRQVEEYTSMDFSDKCYDKAMELLESLYGGAIRENGRVMLKFQQTKELQNLNASELSRLFIRLKKLKDFHEEKGNDFCLTNAASTEFRDARTKLGEFLREYDLWTVRSSIPPCFNSLLDWVQNLHEAAQLTQIIDGGSEEDEEYANVGDSDHGQQKKRSSDRGNKNENKNHRGQGRNSRNSDGGQNQRKSHNTPKRSCAYCDLTNHKVEHCFKAKKLSKEELGEFCRGKRLCFRCLEPGHLLRNCPASDNVECKVPDCRSRHHWFLHSKKTVTAGKGNKKPKQWKNKNKEKSHGAVEESEDNEESSDSEENEDGNKAVDEDAFQSKGTSCGKIGIQVTTVNVHYKGKSIKANVLLDEGSNSSNITEGLARKLGMKYMQGPVNRTISVMSGKKVVVSSNLVRFSISPVKPPEVLKKHGVDKKTRFELEAWTMADVCGKNSLINWEIKKKQFKHLKDIPLPTQGKSGCIDIVLGTDVPGLLAVIESRVGKCITQPAAQLTRLGWIIMGPSDRNIKKKGNISALSFRAQEYDPEDGLNRLAQAYWDSAEPYPLISGTSGNPHDGLQGEKFSATNRKFQNDMHQKAYDKMVIKYNDEKKHFTASIPWKGDRPELKTNRREVMKRQLTTFTPNYLRKKGVEISELTTIIKDYEKKGYVHQLDPSEISEDSWYLPSFPVVDRKRETTKIRLVFDAAYRCRNKSLNGETMTGPNLLKNYLEVLFRFRKYAFTLVGDISEMFLQIHLDADDQRYHRFLFMNEDNEVKDYQWTRTLFGGSSVPNISQKVLHILCEQLGEKYPEAVATLLMACYMDDLVDSRKTEAEVAQTIKELLALLALAGMRPRKWLSNSKEVLDGIPAADRAKEVELVDDQLCLNDGKILGVKYSPSADVFFMTGSETPGGKTSKRKIPLDKDGSISWSKRLLLSTLFKQYDPLGFASPFTIRGKVILQRLQALNIGWDDPIPNHYLKLWQKWLSCLGDLEKIKIKRHIGLGIEDSKHSLVCFVDASLEAYSAVFYLRTELQGEFQVSFLMSRTRVTPIKAISVARLELMAAHLGAETSVVVRKYLGETMPMFFFTDSRDVLFWLNQPSKCFKMFVANRTGTIQSLTKVKDWRHVCSAKNSADIATRGLTVAELATNDMWWKGPEFLHGPEEEFPPKFNIGEHTVEKEINAEFRPLLNFQCLQEEETLEKYLDPQKYSVGDLYDGWKKLLHRAARLFNFDKKVSQNRKLARAELLLVRMAQAQSYKDIIEALEGNKPLPKKHSLAQFAPFLDEDGVLRSKSRLEHSDIIPQAARLPILLPSRHRITFLMTMSLHRTLKHAVGDSMLRGDLAKRYVIPSMYYLERKIKKECLTCIKKNAQKAEQMMAPLPKYRLTEPLKAFSRTGMDFAGPFHIKMKRETRAQALRPKHYVLVFTCLQTRAVHFEVTPSIDTDAVLNALSRFCDRRGVPNVILSDNARSFEAAEKVLKDQLEHLDHKRLKEATAHGYKQSPGIEWHYIPPYGSHFGGIYETIVKSFKRALYATYGYADLLLDDFVTAVSGAEGLLNNRPLAEVKMQPEDSVVLTPNHFLHNTLDDLYQPSDPVVGNLAKKWRYMNTLQTHYKKRFINEVLSQMHPRKKWKEPVADLKIGDLVIELSDSEPRSLWKLARVVEIMPGIDEKVRTVKIKVRGSDTEYVRPIHRLLPLEFGSYDDN
jgi:hypothetical protein